MEVRVENRRSRLQRRARIDAHGARLEPALVHRREPRAPHRRRRQAVRYVYLDPANPPKTVMLQFNDGNWEHRAFWGEDLIPFGAGGSTNHLAMGPLPAPGQWV